MAAKTQSVWRMAFSEGWDGEDHWPRCFRKGIAVIAFAGDLPDLTNVDESEFARLWAECSVRKFGEVVAPSLQGSFRKLRYQMQEGDIIYAKSRARIVGKGQIISSYQYKRGILGAKVWSGWAHFRRVKWERNFPTLLPGDVPLVLGPRTGAILHTVLRLAGKRLTELLAAEEKARRGGGNGEHGTD